MTSKTRNKLANELAILNCLKDDVKIEINMKRKDVYSLDKQIQGLIKKLKKELIRN